MVFLENVTLRWLVSLILWLCVTIKALIASSTDAIWMSAIRVSFLRKINNIYNIPLRKQVNQYQDMGILV